mgnify:FL=1
MFWRSGIIHHPFSRRAEIHTIRTFVRSAAKAGNGQVADDSAKILQWRADLLDCLTGKEKIRISLKILTQDSRYRNLQIVGEQAHTRQE